MSSFSKDLSNDVVLYNVINQYKKPSYYNIPCAFDIETSSFYENKKKRACMYMWQLAIVDHIIIGRTWKQFIACMQELIKVFYLNENRRLILYVHNLAFEFQWISKLFTWTDMLTVDMRKPIYVVSSSGLEFRCSYMLSGLSLEKTGENLVKYKVKKRVGDLDYKLLRGSTTPITEKELGYGIADVQVIINYITEQIEMYGNITKIPLTNTGRVRNYVRDYCFKDKSYIEMIHKLVLTDDEYKILKEAFQGGFTHGNADYIGMTAENVSSYDFTSSYPTQLIAQFYPMSKGEFIEHPSENVSRETFKNYLSVFQIIIKDVKIKDVPDCIISLSKCRDVENAVTNNGRIVTATKLETTLTNIDLKMLEKFYDFKIVEIKNMYRYKKGYLPKPFIQCILKFYQDKTVYKNVADKIVEYMNGKGMLNSMYGMIVTDALKDVAEFIDNWKRVKTTTTIDDYNNNKKRFLFYPWGVFCTAYSRSALFSGILECGNDYIYSDTDSVKIINRDKHLDYFEKYNTNIVKKLERTLRFYNIDVELLRPKDIDGEIHQLGIWDFEGTYKKFKTLGAKRYCYIDQKNEFHMTVSGINKKKGADYMVKHYKNPMKHFCDELEIPKGSCGKQTHTYIDEPTKGTFTDYLGNIQYYDEQSSIHIEDASYNLSLSQKFKDYLIKLKGGYISWV